MSHLVIALLLLDTDAPSAEPVDLVICKKYVETGSLVRRKKICQTKSQWAEESSALRDSATRVVDDRRGRARGD